MSRTRTRVTYDLTVLELGPRLRLCAVDHRCWQLEALLPKASKEGPTALAWRRLGYYARTIAGVQAAARQGVESVARWGEAGRGATELLTALEAVEARFEALLQEHVAIPSDGLGRRPESKAIAEAVEAATRDSGFSAERFVIELGARGLKLTKSFGG